MSIKRPSPARAIAIAYVSAIFMTGIDMHIVNVALPTLSGASTRRSPTCSGR